MPRRRLPAFAPALAIVLGAWSAASGAAGAAGAVAPFLLVLAVRTAPAHRAGIAIIAVALGFLLGAGLADREIAAADDERVTWLGSSHGYREGHWRAMVVRSAERDFDGGRSLRLRGRPEDAAAGRPVRLVLRIPAGAVGSIAGVDQLRAGDRARVWCRAGVPEPYRNPDTPDPALAIQAAGIDAVGTVKSGRLIVPGEQARPGPRTALDAVRRTIRRRLERVAGDDPDVGAVLGALLIGERGELRPAVREGMRDGGVVHVLAVSGLHVSILVLFASALLRPAPRALRHLVITGATIAFVVLVGPRASVVRAAILGLSALAARTLGREGTGIQALALAAAGLTIVRPLAPLDAGFQLSFGAVAAILGTATRIDAVMPLLPRPVRVSLAVSIAAYAGTLPVLAARFHRATPGALVANLIAVPACIAALTSGLAAVLLDGVPGVGPAIAGVARVSVRALLLAGDVGEFLGGPSTVLPPGGITTILFLVTWVALASSARERPSPGAVWLALAACAWIHVGPPPGSGERAGVFLVDVGQGQALFASDGRGSCVVVDTAGSWSPRFDPGERVFVPELLRHGCRTIPVLALSHDHMDHVGGARALVRALPVDELWLPAGTGDRGPFRALAAEVRARGGAVVGALRGTRRATHGIEVEAVHPGERDLDLGTNDRSLVVRLRHAGVTILIAGDLEAAGEAALLRSGGDPSADILVVGHHGSRGASSPSFVDAVAPREAWISVGRGNRFGHPAKEVIERLENRRITIRRTDLDGRIALEPPSSIEPDRNRHERHEKQDRKTDRDECPARPDR